MRTFLIMVLLALAPQTTSPNDPGSVEGVVRRTGAAEPIPNVRISLTRAVAAALTATTDATGRFSIKSVPPGVYTVTLQRDSFLRPIRGGGPKTLTVAARQEIKDLALTLIPGAAITGRITDTSGKPLMGIPVAIFEIGYRNGKRILASPTSGAAAIAQARTNDLGEYRLFWLLPGEYYIRAQYSPALGSGAASQEANTFTFYPGTPDPATVSPIVIREGAESNGMSFSIPTRDVGVKITGKLVNQLPAGDANFRVNGIVLIPRDSNALVANLGLPFTNLAGFPPPIDGRFEIRGVRPGSYDIAFSGALLATSAAQTVAAITAPSGALGRIRVDVSNVDITDLSVPIQPGPDVKGRVVIEGNDPTIRPESVRIQVATDYEPERPRASPGPAGAFIIPNLLPDHYRFGAGGLPQGAYVVDVRQGSRSIYDTGVDIERDPQPIEIVVNTAGGSLEGIVWDGQQKPATEVTVVLAPAVSRRQNINLYKFATTDEQGHFSLTGIAPGDYKVFAWESIPSGAYQSADFIAKYEGRGQAVTVTASARQNVRMELIAKPQQ